MKAFALAYVQALRDICQIKYPGKSILLEAANRLLRATDEEDEFVPMEAEPEELEDDDPSEDGSLMSDEPVDSDPAVAPSLESQGWDEWEEQCFSEWHPRG